jgi:hypothetical protein
MDGSLEWLSTSAFARAMRDIVWLWPALESIHFIGLALVIGAAGYLDLRLMGFMRGVPVRAVKAFIPWAMAGFAMNLVSGVLFFIMAPEMYAFSFAFWSKIAFILIAGGNAMAFETFLGQRVLALGPNEDTPMPMKIVGAVSLFSWFAVLYIGRMLPYIGTGN